MQRAMSEFTQSKKGAKVFKTNSIEMGDEIKLDEEWGGYVQQPGYNRSLIVVSASPESGCSQETMWADNDRLHVTARHSDQLVGDEPEGLRII